MQRLRDTFDVAPSAAFVMLVCAATSASVAQLVLASSCLIQLQPQQQ